MFMIPYAFIKFFILAQKIKTGKFGETVFSDM